MQTSIGKRFFGALRFLAFVLSLYSGNLSYSAAPDENVNADRIKKVYDFDLPAQPLSQSLGKLSEFTQLYFLFPFDLVAEEKSHPVKGRYTAQQALDIMLTGSGFIGELSEDKVFFVKPINKGLQGNDNVEDTKMNKQKSLLAAVIGMFAGTGASAKNIVVQEESQGWMLEEIVVTASKRSTSLQDTAMAISVLGKDTINKRNLVGMGDYLNSLPSVTVLDQGPGFNSVVIRGLSASPQLEGANSSPISGVYFGETAISGFGILGNSPDIKLVDMERVEVLRGPQGTLYGAGAMGGVVRNIPAAPNLEQIEGKLEAGFSSTGEEGGDNNMVKGVINIPLIEDSLAIRATAYRFDDSGYYKNIAASDPAAITSGAVTNYTAVTVNQDGRGSSEVTGGRISALWQPIDQLTVNLSYLNQQTDQDGRAQADFDLPGGFSQSRFALRTSLSGAPDQQESLTDDIEITNLTLNYDLGWATITSASSWVDEESGFNIDASAFVGGAFPLGQPLDYSASLFAEEIRLVSQLDGPWQFIAGLYYEERETGFVNETFFGGQDPNLSAGLLGANAGELLFIHTSVDRKLEQQAFFGELSYDLTENLKLTLGARTFDYDREVINKDLPGSSLLIYGATPVIAESSEKDTFFKAGLEYAPNDSILLYTTLSEGFRLGYPVPGLSPARAATCDLDGDGNYDGSSVPVGDRGVDSDTVESIELGGKFALLNDQLTVNVAMYQVDWDGIPVSVLLGPDNNCGTVVNAGQARSKGVELEMSYRLTDNLSITASSSYVNAELTEDAPAIGGSAGDRLPGSADTNASLGLEYNFSLASYDAYLRSDYVYVSGFYNNLQELGTEAGDYSKLNVKTGININDFSIDLFVDNLMDDDGITWVDQQLQDNRGNRLRPRTIGLNVGYHF